MQKLNRFCYLFAIIFITFGILEKTHSQTIVSITNYGAVGNGTTDNLPALNRAIADAQARGLTLSVPAGTFAYRGVIRMTGVKLIGSGHSSVLYSLDYENASIFVYGSGAEIRNLKLTGVRSPMRLAPWEATRITLFSASNFVIDNVYIEGSAAAGIQTADGAHHGRISNNIIRNTLSDSIHMTGRASFLTVENNFIENSGDDGIAVVSYQSDGSHVHDITARNNRIINNRFGRNMSVVGGTNILYENNYMDGNPEYACLYLSQEDSYHTFGVYNVTAQHNTLKNCGSARTGHATVMIYTSEEDYLENIKLIRNDIYQSSSLTAVRIFGQKVRSILFDSNKINGTSFDYSIQSPNVTLIRYTSGSVGYVEPGTTPAPTPSPTPSYVLTITSPAEGATVAGSIQVKGTAPGMLNVEVFNTAGSMLARATPDSSGNFSATVDTKVLANGVQDLQINAWDSVAGAAFTHTDEKFLSINVQNVTTPTVLQSTPSSIYTRRGRSFNLTYNFSGGPTATAMKVFVHFINSHNQIVFGDDHIPAKSTTTWNGNYSYTRRVYVPSRVARGTYRVVVGLYDPITGMRLSLNQGSGVLVLPDLRYQVGTLSVR